MRRFVVGAVLAVGITASPSVVFADPPGPTDFRTTIVAIAPPAPQIEVSIVGGDSFVSLRVARGTTVAVPGYRGEPFLEYRPSGEVRENRASITYHASRSRYGSDVPAGIDPAAPPEWHRVADDGVYAWHDHRAHWMYSFDPPGRTRGDVVLEATIPLIVDGRSTTVSVISTWQPRPSRAALWSGVLIGVVVAGGVVAGRRQVAAVAGTTVAVAVVAGVLGWWQFRSVPAETGPSWLGPTLPTIAVASAIVASIIARRRRSVAWAAVLLAGVELLLWAWTRRGHIDHAILPTNAPWPLDRTVTMATLIIAATVTTVAARGIVTDAESSGTERPVAATMS